MLTTTMGKPSNVKQVIVVRKDLGMRKGKMIAQGAHASMAALLQFRVPHGTEAGKAGLEAEPGLVALRVPAAVTAWLDGAFAKIAVGIDSEAELLAVHEAARAAGLPTALIRDAGRTEFSGVATLTACAVGPGEASEVDVITGDLKLL